MALVVVVEVAVVQGEKVMEVLVLALVEVAEVDVV